ncbi:MAG: hypothetical protein E7442_00790 [Ruminococcaceae bacterium]|nr:hypothetical protein [Oscillospiraceae bacterium]
MVSKRDKQVWCCQLDDWEESGRQRQREAALKARQLDFVSDARELSEYIRHSGCSQEDCAKRLGRSQSSVANRLRLLKLPEDVLEALMESELSERHGRALLRLPDAESQRMALEHIRSHGLSVAEAESYVEMLLPTAARRRMALENEEILINSFRRCMETLRKSGIGCELEKQSREDALILTIFISKTQKSSLQRADDMI